MDSSRDRLRIVRAVAAESPADSEAQIYRELERIGAHIARLAQPIAHQGGDHDYDGAMERVWKGLHLALGHSGDGCMLHLGADRDCAVNARRRGQK